MSFNAKGAKGNAKTRKERLKQFLITLFQCRIFRAHDWTCAAEQGIPPTEAQVRGGVPGFYDYAKMYCRRCGHVSELSLRRMGLS